MNIELRIPSPNDPAIEAAVEARRPLNRPSILRVDRDAFIRELAAEAGVHAGLIRTVVRAFLAAALRGRDARTPDGWRSVIQDLRYVLGSALRDGVKDRRPVHPPEQSLLPVPVEPPVAPRDPAADYSDSPMPPQVETDPVDGQDVPVRLVQALVRAYVAARMSGDEGATPEGRSRILGETRELVWDGMLDAVKQVPRPPSPRPPDSARASRRTPPERER
ncbi:MAG TPA: hypothetical protein VJT32_01530 [bacterium]|nr:hypothetical protein [bacterium]